MKPLIPVAGTSPHILNHLADIFELANLEVRTATSDQKCIDIFRGIKDKVDIILVGGAIAGDEGVGVIISVRREKSDQKIMVVVEEENVRAAAMKVGADVVVLKSITPETVLQKVNDLLLQTESFKVRKRAKFERRK